MSNKYVFLPCFPHPQVWAPLVLTVFFKKIVIYRVNSSISCPLLQYYKNAIVTISFEEIKADPDKVSAIKNMSPTADVNGVRRRFLGIVNQLAKILLDFADIANPLRKLLFKKNLLHWGTARQKAFEKIQNLLTYLPIL